MLEPSADVYERVKGRQPDKASKEWLDWCWVWNRCASNQPAGVKRRIDAGKFDYQDFVAIWKSTARERKR